MLWSAFRDICLHAFADRQCTASLAGPTIHEQQPLFSRETWRFFSMWLVTSCAKPPLKLSVSLPRFGMNQSIYMTSESLHDPTWLVSRLAHAMHYKDIMEQASFTHVYTCCSLHSIVLAPPSFRKLRSMSKCPDSQDITTESVGKCSAFKRCDPAGQSCMDLSSSLAINPASKIEDLCFIEWTFFSTIFAGPCCSNRGDSPLECHQPRLYRPRSFGIMLYTSWK